MKKFVLILSVLFMVSCAHNAKYDKEFKNPVFNQPLRPISLHSGVTYLTPNSIEIRKPLDRNKIDYTGKCDLLENEQDHITLKCKVALFGKTSINYYTYEVEELFLPACLRIAESIYEDSKESPKKIKLSEASFCVTPPQNITGDLKHA